MAWVIARDDDEPERTPARAVSLEDLNELAASLGHPLYWAGPRPGWVYELTHTDDGRVYVRYLPAGAEIGDPRSDYLSVGTYPQANAFATLQETADAQGVETVELLGGGLGFQDRNRPSSFYLAYPGLDLQIEVYAPSPATPRALVLSGQIQALGAPPPAASEAVSPKELEQLAATLEHPIYWAGEEPDTTYELTRTPDGGVYVRYLPENVEVGVREPRYLTIGTYAQKNALDNLTARAGGGDVETIELDDGGLAFVDAAHPTSVYMAYPDGAVQIEVYHPESGRARELVTDRRIQPIG